MSTVKYQTTLVLFCFHVDLQFRPVATVSMPIVLELLQVHALPHPLPPPVVMETGVVMETRVVYKDQVMMW